jgi:hypothetical protein
MLLEGYIEFENEIPVAKECLGKEYPIIIAGVKGLLVTPMIFQEFDKTKSTSLLSPNKGNVKYGNHFDWGSISSWPKGDSAIRACIILFHNVDEKFYEETGNKIALELHKWRNLLIDNISLMLEKDFRGTKRSKTYKSYGIGEFRLFRKNREGEKSFIPEEFKGIKINVSLDGVLGFSLDGFQELLNATSDSKTPLLPFYFLFDAERAKFEKNYRKSVLDSATAVEICLSFLVSKLLPINEDLNKYVIAKHYSLRLKRDLLKVLKVSLPVKEKEYIDNLDSIRNKVIHAGHIPSAKEASNAYKIAKETLHFLLPKRYEI